MILKMFAIHDSKAEAYLPPMFYPTSAMAIRAFTQAANAEDHEFNTHAGDYTLFELGAFDQLTGKLNSPLAPINLGTAHTFITSMPAIQEIHSQ